MLIILVASIAAGAIWNIVSEGGLLTQGTSTAGVARAYETTFVPKIGTSEVDMLSRSGAVLVDARYPVDFAGGHIEGAINVPVNATDAERHKALAGVPKDDPIVVYCQSAGCEFAEKVAVVLIADGFSRVSVYRDGWIAWKVTPTGAKRR
jgi:rhodanese-related sulfurtransferase